MGRQVPVPYVNVPEVKIVEVPVQKSKVGLDDMTKIVYNTQMRSQGNMNDMTRTVYDTQLRTDGNMTKTVYDTQMPAVGNMTKTAYDTQMPTDGNMANPLYDTQTRTGGSMTNSGYDTQMRTHGIPQTKVVTKPSPVYNEVPKPAPSRSLGTGYGGGDARSFNAVAPAQPAGTGYGGGDDRSFGAAQPAGTGYGVADNRAFDAVALPRPRGTDYGGTDYGGADKPAFHTVDTKDGAISFDEYTAARAVSNRVIGPGGRSGRPQMQTQKYQVPVTKYYKRTVMETREREVPVPYYVDVPETKYLTVTEKVPVKKSKVEVDNVTKTVYEPQMRTRCVPRTKMVKKQIPVYNVVPKPAPPCPPETECGGDKPNVGNPVPTYLE